MRLIKQTAKTLFLTHVDINNNVNNKAQLFVVPTLPLFFPKVIGTFYFGVSCSRRNCNKRFRLTILWGIVNNIKADIFIFILPAFCLVNRPMRKKG